MKLHRTGAVLLGGLLAAVPGWTEGTTSASTRHAVVAPQQLTVRVLRTLPHDPEAFTQGLLWHDGKLYESTGLYGASSLRRLDAASGAIEQQVALPPDEFGEGLALREGELVQLTWLEGKARRLGLEDFALRGIWTYPGEGWGLCFDGRQWVMSDGSSELRLLEADSFAERNRQPVRAGDTAVDRLNELECAEGWVYANRLGSPQILRIDPGSGDVVAVIDASALDPGPTRDEQVLNGIAYDTRSQTFYLTGKRWSWLYEVIFVPVAP